MNKRCVALYSGGLDSLLSVIIMQRLGFDVHALFVQTPFYKKNISKMEKQLNQIGVDLKIVKNDGEYLRIIKNPMFGYGKNMNPCIDCKIFFFKMAKQFMDEIHADFLVSGEVVGQRPMSQRSYAVMRSIEKQACVEDIVLRPLCAKLMPPTKPEIEGIIKRDDMFKISGRSRKNQLEMIKAFGIDDFESPAGGCLLTDRNFAERLKEMFKFNDNLSLSQIDLLALGRHFRIGKKKFIVSRNQPETEYLTSYRGRLPLVSADRGACGVFFQEPDEYELSVAAAIIMRYSKHAKEVNYIFSDKLRIVKPYDISYGDVCKMRVNSQ